jgi:methyl-accepting chemotaxis protein
MLANIASVTQALIKNAEKVNGLTKSSEKGRSDLTAVSANIRDVVKESEGLLEINAVIESIASQTNLLAMNAAVVAGEIRKLAESSSAQAKTVSAVLKKMRDAMGRTTAATDAVLGQFEDINARIIAVSERERGIRTAMDEQGEGSKEILQAIGQLNEITAKVKEGSLQMLSGSREVIEESANLRRITDEMTGSMNEMATGVERISVAMSQVNELSRGNKGSIDVLSVEVGKFLVE